MQANPVVFAATLVFVLTAVPLGHADDVVGSFHRSFAVSGPVQLDVATGAGSIQVTATGSNTVSVDGTLHASDSFFGGVDPAEIRRAESQPPIVQNGNSIQVRQLDRSWGWGQHLWISYLITTPAHTRLVAHSGSGAIQIAGLRDGADLEAGSGRLRAADLGGNLRAQTGSGSIGFDRVGGDVRASAGSGSIEGNEVAGRLNASTGSGDIHVRRLDQGGDLHASSGDVELEQVAGDLVVGTASGSISVAGVLAGSQQWRLSAASGSIRVSLPQSTVAQVHLQTASGGLHVDHPTQRQSAIGRHLWDGVMGSGGATPTATLTAHTASGSIRIN